MGFRKFWFINSNNDKYSFTLKEKKHFLSNPQGLGFTKSLGTTKLGDSEIKISEEYDLPTVTGDLLFYDTVENAYQDYFNLLEYLSFTPIKLYYQPPNTFNSYYIECEVTSIDKGEYSEEGYLQCPISIYGISQWLDANETTLIVTNGESGSGKYYDLIRDYHYAGGNLNDIEVNIKGHRPIGFTFEIFGEVTNPLLTVSKDNNIYGKLKLLGTFDYVRIDSDDLTENITLQKDESYLSNPYNYQDMSIVDGLTQITFIKLKIGKNILSFNCDKLTSFEGYIKITWKDKRVSV